MLRWGLQKGFVVIPKSNHLERQIENAAIFDFTLSRRTWRSSTRSTGRAARPGPRDAVVVAPSARRCETPYDVYRDGGRTSTTTVATQYIDGDWSTGGRHADIAVLRSDRRVDDRGRAELDDLRMSRRPWRAAHRAQPGLPARAAATTRGNALRTIAEIIVRRARVTVLADLARAGGRVSALPRCGVRSPSPRGSAATTPSGTAVSRARSWPATRRVRRSTCYAHRSASSSRSARGTSRSPCSAASSRRRALVDGQHARHQSERGDRPALATLELDPARSTSSRSAAGASSTSLRAGARSAGRSSTPSSPRWSRSPGHRDTGKEVMEPSGAQPDARCARASAG